MNAFAAVGSAGAPESSAGFQTGSGQAVFSQKGRRSHLMMMIMIIIIIMIMIVDLRTFMMIVPIYVDIDPCLRRWSA